jgi:NAD(P)-dependent dehydrogenase (short-subunit alcohol dehydrogenase family)
MTKEKLSLAESLTFLGKKVVVTGAASGIGKAISQRFAEAGASVWLLDVNQKGLSETVGCLESGRCQHYPYEIDVADKTEIDQFWSSFGSDNAPDILVNNAGVYPMEGYLNVNETF